MLATNPAPMRPADREQAWYFNKVLGGRRAELEERLHALHMQAMELTRIGNQTAVRNKRRIIRVLESEAHMIDRMLKALANRLGPDIQP
jgi:hypothetical protein